MTKSLKTNFSCKEEFYEIPDKKSERISEGISEALMKLIKNSREKNKNTCEEFIYES